MTIESKDGPPQVRYFFQGTEKRLGFRIDGKMTVTAASDLAMFRFADVNKATMRLAKSPADISIPFDEKGLERYQIVARGLLPLDASNIVLVEQVPDAIKINGWKGAQFIYTCNLFGFSYRRAIAFLNFSETEQFVFDVSAPVDDYPKIYSRSYHVVNSLFELPLTSEPGSS